MKSLRKWVEEELCIEVPDVVERESYIKGFVAGVRNERKRIRTEIKKGI